jgi:hypothetical protein
LLFVYGLTSAPTVWAVKVGKDKGSAYSARSLAKDVLARNAPALGVSLGVTGREPLNNQPYFQIQRISRDITVHNNARQALDALCDILEELEKVKTVDQARAALRAFIEVRRQWNPAYGTFEKPADGLTQEGLIEAIAQFVAADSEGGKRAQAVAAAMMDLFAGPARVITSRINDPDRHLPGDVGIQVGPDANGWEKVLEIRDKPVHEADLYHFAQKAHENNVAEAAVVAVAVNQPALDPARAKEWALARNVALSLIVGWEGFISQALFWSSVPSHRGVQALPELIFNRLVELEVSAQGIELWKQLMNEKVLPQAELFS